MPQPADVNNPTVVKIRGMDRYDKDYQARKMFQLKIFYENIAFVKILYNTVIKQTSKAILRIFHSNTDYLVISQARCEVYMLRAFRRIRERGITGQQNDPIVNSL